MTRRCPVAMQDCHDDDQCNNCLNFMNTCDKCHEAGHMDAFDAWHEGQNGETLCANCFYGQQQDRTP